MIIKKIDDLSKDGLHIGTIDDPAYGKNSPTIESFNQFITLVLNRAKIAKNESTRFIAYANDFNHLSSKLVEFSVSQEFSTSNTSEKLSEMTNSLRTITDEMVALYTAIEAEEEAITDLHTGINCVEQGLDNLVLQTNSNHLSIAKGRHQISTLEKSIGDLAQKINAVALAMKQFKGSTQQISSVLEVINEIAERTHLLATNAAIEAARAGGIGKGFSVVATEIRMLADSSSQSIDDVAVTLDSTLSALDDAFDAVRAGNKIVDTFIVTTNDVSALFGEFEGSAINIQDGIKKVGNATRDLTAASTFVSKNSMLVKKFTESFQTILQNQSKSYAHVASNVEKVASEASNCSHLATEISDLADFIREGSLILENTMKSFGGDEVIEPDRRRESRIFSIYRLEVIEDQTEYSVGYLDDYSSSGLSIFSNQQFTIGHEFKIRIIFTQALKHEFDCGDLSIEVVIRSVRNQGIASNDNGQKREWIYGCEIIQITDFDKNILRLLSEHAQKIEDKVSDERDQLKLKEIAVKAKNPFLTPSSVVVDRDEIDNF